MRAFLFLSWLSFVNISVVFAQSPGAEQNSMISLIRQKVGFAAEVPATVAIKHSRFIKLFLRNYRQIISPLHSIFSRSPQRNLTQRNRASYLFTVDPEAYGDRRKRSKVPVNFLGQMCIFFHYRGGGCSAFSSNSVELDKYITSDGTISNMEAIRNAYGITTWKAVIGFSYGTDVARRYAHRLPNRIQSLVLEGLDSSDELPPDQIIIRILKTISDRYQASQNLQSRISANDFKNFIATLQSYFSQVSPSQNFRFAQRFGNSIKKHIPIIIQRQEYKFQNILTETLFYTVTLLMYAGESDPSDIAILMLMNSFNFGQIPPEQGSPISAALKPLDKSMFPFLYQDYLNVLNSSGLLSWRVQLTMPGNDKSESDDSVCSSVATIVINGIQDLATPVENVQKFFSNKSCASGLNTALLVQGGGHSSMGSMKCLSQYSNHAMNKQHRPRILNHVNFQ